MTKVIGVRFQSSGRIYYFDPLDFEIQPGDGVIVETARGQEFGDVIQGITEVEETVIVAPLKPVIRIATEADTTMRAQNTGKEDEAFAICQKKIEQHGLDMKLVNVEYAYNGSKVVFYFTADERVDFRELVKDLAAQFRTRIELRQIGVRDEAKMLGGLGSCGRPVCCKTFMDDFRPVSIKMAKEQNLSLSPTKISGLCGRLMCCLQYEQAGYEEMKKKMPRTGKEVLTPDGVGIAIENNAITEKTKVRLTLADGSIDVREYHYSLLARPGDTLPVPENTAPVAAPAGGVSEESEKKTVETPQTAEAPAASAPAEQEERTVKRRRRGGRGRGGNRANASQQDTAEGDNSAAANAKKQPENTTGAKPQRPRKPAQQRTDSGQNNNQPAVNRNQQKVDTAENAEKQNAQRRRRRRNPKPKTDGAVNAGAGERTQKPVE